ncbi:MAG: ectonucleotide pyrophosphatase/phosphodiesterase, partial [Balneolales bacterium]
MQKFTCFIILFVLSCGSHEQTVKHLDAERFLAETDNAADHVILISIDGFRSEFYKESHRPSPMLQKMAKEGVQADGVRGIFPSLTYPSHTTMITGSYPATHGVYYNSFFDEESRQSSWYFFHDDIKTKTLWQIVGEQGGITANVGWPVTVGAPIDYNVVISGALQNSGLADDPIRHFTYPQGLFEELEREATGRIDIKHDLTNSNPSKENRVAEMVSYLLKKHKPQLTTVALQVTDSYQHSYGREAPEVDRALAAADRAIARIVEAAEYAGVSGRTAFVISGDHGFTNISARIAPNVWLVEAGLLEDKDDRGNWRATFHTGGGSAFLHLRDSGDTEAIDKVRSILESLLPGEKKLFRIVERDELDKIGANPSVPFALSSSQTTGMSGAYSGDAIRFGTGGTHGHFPDFPNMETGFIA